MGMAMTVHGDHRARIQTSFVRSIEDETVQAKTGKTWREWDTILDAWGALDQGLAPTAKYVRHEYEISTWWSNTIAARYRWEHGLVE